MAITDPYTVTLLRKMREALLDNKTVKAYVCLGELEKHLAEQQYQQGRK